MQEEQTVGQSGIRRRTWGNSDVCVGPMLRGDFADDSGPFFREKEKTTKEQKS